MSASLPTLPGLSTGVDFTALSQGDAPLNQQLAPVLSKFGPLLQQAVGALGEAPVAAPESLEPLPPSLQGLPQEGKLLPLLQQVLDVAAAEGTDAQTVLHDISAKLKVLLTDKDLEPEQAVATAIQQFIDENPQIAASVDPRLLRGLSGDITRAPTGDTSARPQAGESQQPLTATSPATDTGLSESAAHSTQRTLTGQSRPGGEFMPVVPVQQKTSLDEAAAMFSRLMSEARSAGTPELLSRADNLLTTLGSLTPTPPAAVAAQPSPALHNITLNVPLNQAGWDKALGERVQWMIGQGIQRANIKLNPAHLGPMEIRIQVQNDQASVQFTSVHGVVRDAVEAALPRLRDMFDNAGVDLTDVDVSGQPFAEQQQAATDGQGGSGDAGRNALFGSQEEADTLLETPVYPLPERGRLDLFA